MSEQNPQPDLIDRELIPARAKVSLSRDIGEAVVTENIFGKARVRIIRPGDKMRRMLWTTVFIAGGVAAFAAWQVWLAAQQIDAVPEVAPLPATESAAPVEAVSAVVEAPAAAPQIVAPPPPSGIPATPPAAAVVPPRPAVTPRPPLAQPQSAVPTAATLDATAVPPRVLPRRLPPKPAASAPVAAAPLGTPAPVTAPQTSQAENEANKP